MSQSAQSSFELGKEHLENKRFNDAIKAFLLAIKNEPDIAEYHAYLASAMVKSEQYEGAIQEANLAINIDPLCILAFKRRGDANRMLGHVDIST